MRCQSIALAALAASSALAAPVNVDLNASDAQLISQEAPELADQVKSALSGAASIDLSMSEIKKLISEVPQLAAKVKTFLTGGNDSAPSHHSKVTPLYPAATPAASTGSPATVTSVPVGGNSNSAPTPVASGTPVAVATSTASPSSGSSSAPVSGSSGKNVVAYWGQTTGAADLAPYCASDSGIDTIALSFVYVFGEGSLKGNFGSTCSFDDTSAPSCDKLASAVETCKKNGKKVLVSLGGAPGPNSKYAITSKTAAEDTASKLFAMFGAKGDGAAASRPLGDSFVDGFDLDIENPEVNTYLPDFMNAFRSEFAKDSKNKYQLSAAPQCPWPEVNMGDGLTKAQFDEIYVQFYNNPSCSAVQFPTTTSDTSAKGFNYDAWKSALASTPNKDAKIYIGLPAGPKGAAPGNFIDVAKTTDLVNKFKDDSAFGGVMLWDATNSDEQKDNNCTFAQNMQKILTTGKGC